jgi:hypothetical protein
LEVCVFSYLAAELKSGDIRIAGSESFADYRQNLLGWKECEAGWKDFCRQVGLPDTAAGFVRDLRTKLTETAVQVDQKYPENGDLTISPSGEPVLKKVTANEIPESAVTLQGNITQKMPTRDLLDILVNIEHWTNFTRHFGPWSGSDPKLEGRRSVTFRRYSRSDAILDRIKPPGIWRERCRLVICEPTPFHRREVGSGATGTEIAKDAISPFPQRRRSFSFRKTKAPRFTEKPR